VTAEERELSGPDWRIDSPVLLTWAQAAQLCLVSEEILDQWSFEPGFPVIRRSGGHFVPIHRAALERWLEQFALGTNPAMPYDDAPARACPPSRSPLIVVASADAGRCWQGNESAGWCRLAARRSRGDVGM
jgi:hypothetical protein